MFRLKPLACRNIKSTQISTFSKRLIATEKLNGNLWSKPCREIDLVNNNRPNGIFNSRNVNNNVHCQTRRFSENAAPSATKLHKATNFEKKVLVWNKCYPSVEAVPERVTISEVTKAKDWFRIRVNIGMIIATVIGSIFFAVSGKRAAARGESLAKISLTNATELRKEGLERQEKQS